MSRDNFFDVDWREWDALLGDSSAWEKHFLRSSSPSWLVRLEQHRRRMGVYETDHQWKNTDVFLMSKGRPPRRDLTQIGGLPYRPADAPWPVDARGKPLQFFAQLRFRESRDLVPQAPADMLLIFGSSRHDADDWIFEWRDLDLREELLPTEAECPSLVEHFFGCYGHRCRCRESSERDVLRDDLPAAARSILTATKIGGSPARDPEIGSFVDGKEMWRVRDDLDDPGYFATIDSCQPPYNTPYPWVNHPEPIQLGYPDERRHTYSFFDMFTVNLFFNAYGSIDVTFDQ